MSFRKCLSCVGALAALATSLVLAGSMPANASEINTGFSPSGSVRETVAASATNAATGALTEDQTVALRATMSQGGIDSATQDALLVKLNNGIALDASSGADPASEMTEDAGATLRTTRIYADGSRQWLEVQKPRKTADSHVSRASIGDCSASGGWSVNCKVEVRDVVSFASFVIDYQPSNTGVAKVRDMRDERCGNTVGSCTASGAIKRATQSGSAPAWAELVYSNDGGPAAARGTLGIRVMGASVTTY